MAMFGIGSLNIMFRQPSSVVGKTNISFSFHSLEVIFYFHWWKRHTTPLSFKTLLHENPDEFAVKVIVISWKFNLTGRLSLTKINLWLWIDERKENIKNNQYQEHFHRVHYHTTISVNRLFKFVILKHWCTVGEIFLKFDCFCIFYFVIEDILGWIKIVWLKIICFDQQVAYVVLVTVLRKRRQKDKTQEIQKGIYTHQCNRNMVGE